MKIVIVGYGDMLKALVEGFPLEGHEIVGVFRHDNVIYSPVRKFFKDRFSPSPDFNLIKYSKLYDIKANSVNSEKFRRFLIKNDVDTVFVGSWSEKFSKETINTPKYGIINVHPSLLPKYRGPNPYLHVLLNDEKITGVTFHLMNEKFDRGEILYQQFVNILPDDTGITLKYRTCETVKKEAPKLIDNFQYFFQNRKPQDENKASYQPGINIKETILEFESETSVQIRKRIRALTPWCPCFIPFKNEFFSFETYKIKHITSQELPGTVIEKTDNSFSVVCKDFQVIEFFNPKINRAFSHLLTRFYLKHIIKVGKKAL